MEMNEGRWQKLTLGRRGRGLEKSAQRVLLYGKQWPQVGSQLLTHALGSYSSGGAGRGRGHMNAISGRGRVGTCK